MKPLVRGEETDLVEIPASWYLDDLPPMMFIKTSPNSHGFVNPRHIEEMWRDQFDWVYRESDYAVFTFTIHPDVSGRPQVLLMLERLIEHINGHEGVTWTTFDAIADDFVEAPPPHVLTKHQDGRTGRCPPSPDPVPGGTAGPRPAPGPRTRRRGVPRESRSSPGPSPYTTSSFSAPCCRASRSRSAGRRATPCLVSTLVSVGTAIVVLGVGPMVDRLGGARE